MFGSGDSFGANDPNIIPLLKLHPHLSRSWVVPHTTLYETDCGRGSKLTPETTTLYCATAATKDVFVIVSGEEVSTPIESRFDIQLSFDNAMNNICSFTHTEVALYGLSPWSNRSRHRSAKQICCMHQSGSWISSSRI
jgi:hypothetical protein